MLFVRENLTPNTKGTTELISLDRFTVGHKSHEPYLHNR